MKYDNNNDHPEKLVTVQLLDIHSTCNKVHGIFAVYKESAGVLF